MMELPDKRNADIKIYVNGALFHRDEAKISVFDSVVQGGDAVWEGIRVYKGFIYQLDAHLDRLMNSAHIMGFCGIPSREEITRAIRETLKANGMDDETHIRLTLTRGEKVTSGMSPGWNIGECGLIVLAEWKKPVYDRKGIRLITSSIRRNPPQCLDSKIHHNNLINNILAKMEANIAGVDDALMLDVEGYVSETNATNVFVVSGGKLHTPFADHCLPGITRAKVMGLALQNDIPCSEKRLSLSEMYTADEVFVTGTMGELTPVLEIDGRMIRGGFNITNRLIGLYTEDHLREPGTPISA
jgi:branched-chain amino acid aminotransferase group I